MADQAQKFEDPEGLPEPDADEIEIEVLDDTPVEDIRAARPAAERTEIDGDDFEEEIKKYSENAQKRIKGMTFEVHEERRAKEAAQRQSEEAVRFAEQVTADNVALKKGLDDSNDVLIKQYGEKTNVELEKARAEFKVAYDDGDTDALLAAQENISRLHAESAVTSIQADRLSRPQAPQQPQQPQQPLPKAPALDVKAKDWLDTNTWFQKTGNEAMTGYAVGLHQQLVSEGLNPLTDPEYYTKIDQGMLKMFPDQFPDGDLGGVGEKSSAAIQGKKKPPVGGPSRGGKSPRKVQLTTTQVALAKRLGLTNKQYAAQVAKEQLTDG